MNTRRNGGRHLVSAWICFVVLGLLGLGMPSGLAHSNDGGHGGGGSPSLPTDTLSAAGFDAFEPQVASDREGNSLAVWTRSDGSNLRVEAALRAEGENYGAPVFLSEAGQDAFEPQVAVNRDGDAVVVWTRFDGTNERIQSTSLEEGSGSFTPVETISEAGEGASQPQVAIDHRGNALATWTRFDGANLRVQASFRHEDGSFGAAQTLSAAGLDAFEPQVDFDHFNGNALVVWTGSDGTNTRVQASFRPAWGAFKAAELVSEAGQDAFEPQVALDHKGSATVVWTRFDGSRLRVQSSFRSRWDGFQPAETISEPGQDAFEPQVAVDRKGNATAVWTRFDGTNERIQSAFREYYDSFEPAETISAAGQGASEPQVALDDSGNALAVWSRSDGANLRVQSAFRPKWKSFGGTETLSDAGQDAFDPQVTLDADGDAIAIWVRSDGTNSRIQVGFRPRGLFFGGAQSLSADAHPASQPQVAADGSGNSLAVWTEFDGANLRVRAAFARDGKKFGEAETLSAAGFDAFEPQVAFDGNGKAYVVWTRFDGANTRVEAASRSRWGHFDPAVALSAAGQDAFEPQIAVDPKGNAVAAWTGSDGTNLRVQAAFKPKWSSFEAAENLSAAGQDGFEPAVAIDESGNALVVWTRSDGANLRIQGSYRPRWKEFEPAVDVSAAGNDASQPQVAFDRKGNALAIWTASDGANLRVQSALRPKWDEFESPETVSVAGLDAFEPQVAFDPDRNAIAVWTQSDGVNTRIAAAYRPKWNDFGAPVTISAAGEDAFEPQVAVDEKGNALAIWTRSDGVNLRIQSAFKPRGNGFRTPETISSGGQDAFEPQVAFGGDRDAVAVWTRFDGANERVQADFRPRDGSFGAAAH